MVRPRIVLLIFVSGKIVLTGAKVREEIYQAFENMHPVLTGKLLCRRLRRMPTNIYRASLEFRKP